jgi:serine/threonine-protein kinase
MSLNPGTRLGSYEIIGLVGAGGMGEVYRARDCKLGRSVAIKVLPAALAGDRERISRFEREARALAALNHPYIATLFGLEEAEHEPHRHLLVMELVEGETLAERLRRGPLPPETALALARQIAEALEAAHEKGIIHRDLKPANIKITQDENVKVLDFGLAKAMDAGPEPGGTNLANSPTVSSLGTQVGVILGTAAYMSPEQAKGQPTDHRSDVFSFGVVLFEMLTGRRPFHGETVSDILASVLVRDVDLGALPPALNPRLPDLLRRCLEKSPKRRWQAIGDVRAEIEIIMAAPFAVPASAAPTSAMLSKPPLWRRALPLVGVAVMASALTGTFVWMTRPMRAPAAVTRFQYTLPDPMRLFGTQRSMVTLSPDGRLLAFSALASAGQRAGLYVRPLDALDATRVVEDDSQVVPIGPVFSPDGHWLVYWTTSDQALIRIPANGGAALRLCQTELPSGLTWSTDGIVFSNTEGIHRVSSDGGRPELLVKASPGEIIFGPQILPGGRTLLFTAADASGGSERWDAGRVVVLTIGSADRRTIVDGGTDARYLPSGHLVFGRAGVVYAVPFDLSTLAIAGREVPVIEGVMRGTGTYGSGTLNMSVASDGTLAFVPGPLTPLSTKLSIGYFDRTGASELLPIPPGSYQSPRVSPGGAQIAFVTDDGKDVNVWVYDAGRGHAPRRLTFSGTNRSPAWSADGQRIAFRSDRDGAMAIYWQRADGSGVPERLTTPGKGETDVPMSFSPDGAWLLFDRLAAGRASLFQLSLRDRTVARVGAVTSTLLTGAVFSPDGQWIAYASREAGRSNQLFVEPFPPTGVKYLVSNSSEDAHHPIWSPDGTALFYTPGPGPRLMRVLLTLTPGFASGAASVVERPFANVSSSADRPYDITGDGKRFLSTSDPDGGVRQITVVRNWFEELRAKVGK